MSTNNSKSSRGRLISAVKKVGRSKPDPAPRQSPAYFLDLTLVDSLPTYSTAQSPIDSLVSSRLSGDQHFPNPEPEIDMLEMENMAWGAPPTSLNSGWLSSIFVRRDPPNRKCKDSKTT